MAPLHYPTANCPSCLRGANYEDAPWQPPSGLDPEMKRRYCPHCRSHYYLAPFIRQRLISQEMQEVGDARIRLLG